MRLSLLGVAGFFVLLNVRSAEAQRHRSSARSSGRGVPCGRSYISADKVCHKDTPLTADTPHTKPDTSAAAIAAVPSSKAIATLPVPVTNERGMHSWNAVFSVASKNARASSLSSIPCYGVGLQPDSVYLTVAQVGNVEAWTGASGWQALSGNWAIDTIGAALRAVECLGDGKPSHVIVERDARFLRVNVVSMPRQPPDIVRARNKKGRLAQLVIVHHKNKPDVLAANSP